MQKKRITLQALSKATKDADPEGRGIGFQTIAALITDRDWSRETCEPRTATLIAAGLGKPVDSLFIMPAAAMPPASA